MITTAHLCLLADYNRWQNRSIYGAAATLADAQRRENSGAFFGSIHGTLSHLLWGDQIWMHRFAGTGAPAAQNIAASKDMVTDWEQLCAQRSALDDIIVAWAASLDPAWLEGDLSWFSGGTGCEVTRPKWILVVHMFNHQTHHRGQVHCMLTQAGAKPEDTDLPLMPADA
jgi:uncharacterized damage-inducible protein DinB